MTPAHVTLRPVHPDHAVQHPESTRQAQPHRTLSQRRRKVLIPLAVAWFAMAAVACVLLLIGTKPSTAFGDTAVIPGGLARISAVIPLESDGWVPPSTAGRLDGPVQPGAHRVRILLDLTAVDAAGLSFDAADYSLSGVGSRAIALWGDPSRQQAAVGASVLATLVFEVPDQAVAPVLDGPQGARLSLGTEHHTAP